VSRPATAPNPGPVPGGIRPLRSRPAGTRPGRDAVNPPAMPADRSPMYTEGSGAQDGVNSGPSFEPLLERSAPSDGVEPGHIHSAGVRPKSVHAVEFSKTVAPLLGGASSSGARPGPRTRSRGGPTSIALKTGVIAKRRNRRPRILVRVDQDRTWTLTVRSRGRSSKSMRTICCQVPSVGRPSSTGTVSDGPMIAAR